MKKNRKLKKRINQLENKIVGSDCVYIDRIATTLAEEVKKTNTSYDNFQEAYSDVSEKLALKTEGERTKYALKILDYLRDMEDVSVGTALDILDDARTVLLKIIRI